MKKCMSLCLIEAVFMVAVAPATASDYSDAVTALGPIAWWRMDDATDSAGSHDGAAGTGISFDQPSVIPGDTSLAAGFTNDADGRIIVPDSTDFHFGTSQDYTIETWVKRDPGMGTTGVITQKSKGDQSFLLRFQNTGQLRFFMDYGNFTDLVQTEEEDTYDDGLWHHVVASADRDGMLKLFVDGQLKAEKEVATWNGSIDSDVEGHIGMQIDKYNYNGHLDEFAIYDQALTATQVLDHYNAGTGVSGNYQTLVSADNPVGWWRMDDATDTANGHTTTASTGVTFGQTGAISGDASSSALFDGTAEAYMQVADTEDLKFGKDGPISMEVWVKRDPGVAAPTAVWRKGLDQGSYFMRVQTDGTAIFVLDYGLVGSKAQSTATVDDGQWHHLVGVGDRVTGVKLYVDGVLDGEFVPWEPDITNTKPLDIGANDAGRFLGGTIDELVFYDQALSDAQVLALYNTVAGSWFTLPGDANNDGFVNDADAAILSENWLAQTDPENWQLAWTMGDFNGDGVVDDVDATLLASNWQTTTSASVPEAGMLSLLLAALSTVLAIRRRK